MNARRSYPDLVRLGRFARRYDSHGCDRALVVRMVVEVLLESPRFVPSSDGVVVRMCFSFFSHVGFPFLC